MTVVLSAFVGLSEAGQLYRLRVHGPEAVAPGATFTLDIVLDNTNYPDPEVGPDTDLDGLTFELSIPAGVQLESEPDWSPEFSDPVTESSLFASIVESPGAVTFAIFFGNSGETIPAGTGHRIATIPCRLAVDAEGTVEFGFGNRPVGSRGARALGLHTRAHAIVVQAMAEASPASGGVTPFPEPTAAELLPLGAAQEASPTSPASASIGGESSGEPMGAGAGGPEPEYCQIPLGIEMLPDYAVTMVFPNVPGTPNPIETAIDDLYPGPVFADNIILCSPGTYYGQIAIDATRIGGDLIILSQEGPDTTTIDADDAPGAILITGDFSSSPLSPTSSISIGWTIEEDLELTHPRSPGAGPNPANMRGWRGFKITNAGTPTTGLGAGIICNDVPFDVSIRGNYIDDFPNAGGVPQRGAGVYAGGCANVNVVLNEIRGCRASSAGAGLYFSTTHSQALLPGPAASVLVRNWIYDNEMSDWGMGSLWSGGGVYVIDRSLEMCSNRVFQNRAASGCGVSFVFDLAGVTAWMSDNLIHGNSAAEPKNSLQATPYRGGGISIVQEPQSPPLTSCPSWSLGLVNNRVYENDITIADPASFPMLPNPSEVAGGVFLDVNLWDCLGPLEISAGFAGSFLISNSFYDNVARNGAGGLFLAVETLNAKPFRLWANTIRGNQVISLAGPGSGIWIPERSIVFPAGVIGEFLDAHSNVIRFNDDPSQDWFVDGSSAVSTQSWQFSYMEIPVPVGGKDVRDPVTCSTDDPIFFVDNNPGVAAEERMRQERDSPTRNGGTPDSAVTSLLVSDPNLNRDYDSDPRIGETRLDAGGEEYVTYDFRRGDVNLDGMVDISDAVQLLGTLFVPGSRPVECMDAADTNDDNNADVSDAVFLLAWLFTPGSPVPPDPGPIDCGPDPTPDLLDCLAPCP